MDTEEIGRRAHEWAKDRDARVGGYNPWDVAVRTLRSASEDRVTGLAAEMAFFALLSLIPAIIALGAGLGWLERLLGPEAVAQGQAAALTALGAVFSPQMMTDVLRPLIDGLLEQQRGGIALSGMVAALWLASRVFMATVRALDLAYNVEERRTYLEQRLLALAFALCAVVVVVFALAVAVVGPLFGTGQDIADQLGLGEAFALAWSIGRWPVLLVIAVTFCAFVYRVGPNVRNTWRESLPGAALAVALWLVVSAAFRIYLAAAGSPGQVEAVDEVVAALAGAVGAVVAAILWTYLSGIALLLGGELNSELEQCRREAAEGRRARPRPAP